MKYQFEKEGFKKLCSNGKKLIIKYGPRNTRLITQRINEINTISSLGEMVQLRIGR